MKSKKKTRASLSNTDDTSSQHTGGGGEEEKKNKSSAASATPATSLLSPPITTAVSESTNQESKNQDTTTAKTATMWKHFEPDIDFSVDEPSTTTSTTNTNNTAMGGSRGAGPAAAEEEEEIVLDFKTMANPNGGVEDEIVVVMEPAVETVQEDIEVAAANASPEISPDLEASEQDKEDGSVIAVDSTSIGTNEEKQDNPTATTPAATATTLQKTPIPPAFFCPITKQLFLEPVVAPDGITYEKHVLLRTTTTTTPSSGLPSSQLYPNRALQRIMEDYMELTEDTWEAGIRKHIQQGLDYLWSHAAVTFGSSERPLPDAYYCPITFDLFHTPVIDPEGYTYEQAAIVPWIRTNGNSPLSRTHLSAHQLYPNHTLRALLEYQAKQTPTPPALEKWKTEDPPISFLENDATDTSNITSNESWTTGANGQQQPQSLGPIPPSMTVQVSLPPSQYPTTFEELELYRRENARIRRRAGACTVLGVLCFVTALVLGVLYGGYCIFVSIWMGCCVRDSIRRWRILQWEQERDEERTVHRLQDQEERLQELRVRLQELRNTTTTTTTTTSNARRNDGEVDELDMMIPSTFQISPHTTPQQLLERVAAEEQAQRLRLHEERLAELGIHMSPSAFSSRRDVENHPSDNDVEQGGAGGNY